MALDWRSKLIHPEVQVPEGFRSLAPPVHRGSTTLLERAADVRDHWDAQVAPYRYGLYGTPTTHELAARIAELEGGGRCFITPGGQAAIALIDLAFVKSGGHLLVPDSVYGPSRELADRLLARFGIATEYYDPLIGAAIAHLIRPNTELIWCESPGSVTMEVQDVPAIVAAARTAGVITALDNTYSAGVYFDAFGAGVDVTMQALTKFVGGHSDLLLGSVTCRATAHYQALGDTHQLLGMAVSPEDCALALRGLQSLAVRLERLQDNALGVTAWLARQPEIETVLHPAFESCPGHPCWRRDFTGSSSVFSVSFRPTLSRARLERLVDSLRLFRIGYSWGGVTSLAMPFFDLERRFRRYGASLIRFNVGLESLGDLLADLEQAFAQLRSA